MKTLFLAIFTLIFSVLAIAQENENLGGKVVNLSADVMKNLDLKVPEGKFWHIEWKNPNCEDYCSYDIGVEGWLKIGENKKYTIRDTRVRLTESPSGEIWVEEGAIVTVQISPEFVKIVEYSNK